MSSYRFEIADFLCGGTEQPLPSWERVGAWIELHVPPDDHSTVWTAFAQQWLELINHQCFDGEYEVSESANILLLAYPPRVSPKPTIRFAEYCCQEILSRLPGLAQFQSPGKYPILVFSGSDAYYSHLSGYYSEGVHGTSSGMHFRSEYPHIAVLEGRGEVVPPTIAHELTHAGLHYLRMPLWLEEGLTQLFEHDLGGQGFALDFRDVREQKDYWREHGLHEFWTGTGFRAPGDVQKYSYQLAEILMRLLLTDFGPRWFGFDNSRVNQLVNFLLSAEEDDRGAAAAEEHLGLTLSQIVEKSLGPGAWEPRSSE